MTEDDAHFKYPTDLKLVLHLMHKLHNGGNEDFEKAVCGQLSAAISGFCNQSFLEKFYNPSGSRPSGFLPNTLGAGYEILAQITKNLINGPYKSINKSDPECINKSVQALKENMPKVFSALLFLYFNVSTDCKEFGGGHWSSMQVNESTQDLSQWRTDEQKTVGTGRKPLTPELIRRGFTHSDSLKSSTGQDIVNEIKMAVSLMPDESNGSLQSVLSYMLFACPWDPALTAHACLFLYQFCFKVNNSNDVNNHLLASKVKSKYNDRSKDFEDICNGLVSHLEDLVYGSDSKLSAVCKSNSDLYTQLWDDNKFDTYVKWLKEKLSGIIEALQKMSGESKTWNPISFEGGYTAGPFLYGFVPKDKSWTDDNSKSKLQEHISKLIGQDSGSLEKLKRFLENPSSAGHFQPQTGGTTQSGDNSGVTAAGASVGVLSLGGAGVGAAYGFNLFGLKDIMSGVFGAIRGLVVGF
ncbi:hypothetical protein X943_003554 [Babesia divergens]|uniref:Uncharacterized protein n=1 Tax=Babesia divergens TaxID=32595 RepID=A0AAD9GJW7_BABDI|nr:hypothetical protein X943_003554 [Babesia divergens]